MKYYNEKNEMDMSFRSYFRFSLGKLKSLISLSINQVLKDFSGAAVDFALSKGQPHFK